MFCCGDKKKRFETATSTFLFFLFLSMPSTTTIINGLVKGHFGLGAAVGGGGGGGVVFSHTAPIGVGLSQKH